MITPNDLRIGNWLEHKFSDKQFQVEGLGGDLIFNEKLTPLGGVHMSAYSPIPLTPEILEKCGFEITGDFKKNITCDFKSKKLWNGAQVNIYSRHKRFYYWMNETYNIELKSLHQLMNLYFALTNTELKYLP